jgi:DNA gyrase subunit A
VRAHRFLKEDTQLTLAWIGPRPAAATATGEPVELPAEDPRRDGSGTATRSPDVVGHLVQRD